MTAHGLTALAAGLLTMCGTAYACVPDLPGGGRQIESARYTLMYRALPEKIPLGGHFSVELAVCANAGAPLPESVSVDAWMPDHRHGMNYRPSVRRDAGGRYHADGLYFEAGPEVNFALTAVDEDKKDVKSRDVTPVVFNYVVGLGYELPMGLSANIRYDGGISHTYKSSAENDLGTGNLRSSTFWFGLGYAFGGSK